MSDSCNIFCGKANRDEVTRLLFAAFGQVQQHVDGAVHVWFAVGSHGSIRITPMEFQQGGDEFSRLILGMHTFALKATAENDVEKVDVLRAIDKSDFALGVVVDPGFDADERFENCIFEIASSLEGIVFDGSQLISSEGELLLSLPE